MAIIKKLVCDKSQIWCNTYIIGDEGGPCILVDPGCNDNGFIDRYIDKHHSALLAIFLTHGHFDHIAGLETLTHKAPIYMNENDVPFLDNPRENGSKILVGEPISVDVAPDYLVYDGEEIEIGNIKIKIIHTPFHTKGSICLYFAEEGEIITGDTLFYLGVGRTDLPGGREADMKESLRKLAALPPATKVYPGHGPATTIKNELDYNLHMRNL